MPDYFAHESSFVDPGATIGAGTKIWHFCHVSSGAVIGEGSSLGQNVFVAPGVRIGRNVKVQNNVSLYEGVLLEDDVFCGPSSVFTNVTNPDVTDPTQMAQLDHYRINVQVPYASVGWLPVAMLTGQDRLTVAVDWASMVRSSPLVSVGSTFHAMSSIESVGAVEAAGVCASSESSIGRMAAAVGCWAAVLSRTRSRSCLRAVSSTAVQTRFIGPDVST